MTANEKDLELVRRFSNAGISCSVAQANTLRRAELTLHRWCELECGDGNDRVSWSIERDESTGKPYLCRYPHNGAMWRALYPDKEHGALERVKAVCADLGVDYYYQTDPRGAALYVGKGMTDCDYTGGICCAV